jgi:hypothetical protein
MSMAAVKSSIQDRRNNSRDKIILSCRIIFDGNEYDAIITDISPGGVLLRSDFLPPAEADIEIKIDNALISVPSILEGKILRHDSKKTKRNTMEAFAVKFKSSPPELLALIDELANPQI